MKGDFGIVSDLGFWCALALGLSPLLVI